MYKIIMPLLCFSLLLSCQKEATDSLSCIQLEKNNSYLTEAFKSDYSIQFPQDYEGAGLLAFESVMFNKRSSTGVEYYYQYLCATDCHIYFGDTLTMPLPSQISFSDYSSIQHEAQLDTRLEFCRDGNLEQVWYYDASNFGKSLVFFKESDYYLEGLIIDFQKENKDEVIEVLKTIKKN